MTGNCGARVHQEEGYPEVKLQFLLMHNTVQERHTFKLSHFYFIFAQVRNMLTSKASAAYIL